MTKPNTGQEPEGQQQTTTQGTQPPATPPATPPAQPPATPPAAPQGIESLPEWAQKELREARDDAAKYRTKVRELEGQRTQEVQKPEGGSDDRVTQLEQRISKMQDEYEAAIARQAEAEMHSLRVRVGTAAGIPVELAERLQGTTEDELRADAEKVKAHLAPARRGDRSQGRGPGMGNIPENVQPGLGRLQAAYATKE